MSTIDNITQFNTKCMNGLNVWMVWMVRQRFGADIIQIISEKFLKRFLNDLDKKCVV